MRNTTKRYLAVLMALVISISLSCGLKISAQAATVEYVYGTGSYKNYIYNWGVREELATFLSPNAEEFYEDNNITYEELAALDGSSSESSVPSSALYKKLQTLMKSNHSYITSYDKVKYLCDYTDCQNSKKTSNKISSFYSGKEIGPGWTYPEWNREHVWPNSKGDLAGNGENDIMMLRPTASSENGSRGNKAYGESSGYYNPNGESGGKHDLRGDVSRIILYQYVRWGCINTGSKYNPNGIFGTSGVIESKEILLEWIEEDPVDTWELGRNDSIESITGTRNVFVDYPELAFDLFNEEVPSGYTSPSNSAASSDYKVTATSNNTVWGTVSVSKNIISASAANGYETVDYTILKGNSNDSVERIGSKFIVTASGDITVQINFAPTRTVTFIEDGVSANTMTKYEGGTVTIPSHKTELKSGYTFVGWSTATVKDTEKKPAFYTAGGKYPITNDITFYALYSRKQDGKTVYFTNTSADVPSVDTSSKNEQTTSSKPDSNATSSKSEQSTSSKPVGNTSSKNEQNVNSNTVSDSEQNTSSILTETETDNTFVTVNISDSTIVVSDFIKEAISNNIPLVLKAENYTWRFEKIAISPDEVKSFDAAIYVGDEVSEGHRSIIKDAAKGKQFYPISFAHNGALPAKATITIKVDESLAGKEIEIYSVTAGGSTVLEGKATVSDDAALSFKTERASLYFVSEAASDNGASLLWLWILIAVVLVGGGAAVFVLYKKRIIFNAKKQDLA